MPSPGNISIISQSGALCTTILDWAISQKIGLAKLVSMGNKAGITQAGSKAASSHEVYYRAFHEAAMPILKHFDPDVIVMALGMDGLAGDPLAHLNLTNNCYADVVADVVELEKPILAVGGGGYNVKNTVRSWTLMWNILANGRDDDMSHLGMGGVLLENTAWFGGLRDKTLLSHGGYREVVELEVQSVIDQIKNNLSLCNRNK